MANGLNIANQLRTDYIQQPAMSAVQAPFNALKMQGMQQQIGMNELQMEKLRQELAPLQFKDDNDAIEWWNSIKGMVNLGNYDDMKNSAVLKGANPALFPDISTFNNNEQSLQDWIYQADKQLAQIKTKLTPEKIPTPTELSKLIAERNALAKNDPNREIYDKAIAKKVKDTGEIIRTNPDGSVEIIRGGLTEETKKVMPATEVSKIAEFSAYTETMNEIDSLIAEIGGTTKGKTGPLEIVNKRLDNWELWPNEQRIKLRSLVARLPGLMYAMRGKQLSDKELEVALNMMPQMELGPTAFLVQLGTFKDYLKAILKGKKKAFSAAGYKTKGVFPDYSEMSDEDLLKKLGK